MADAIGTVVLDSPDDVALADKMKQGREQILSELHKLIIGQKDVIEEVLLTLFVGGNSLIVGVPGLAKTLLIHTISQVVDLKFSRIQFTPDLLPGDLTGQPIFQPSEGSYTIRRGTGGKGRHPGGDGVVRRLRFLEDVRVGWVAERQTQGPWGLAGGRAGEPGRAFYRTEGAARNTELAGKAGVELAAGTELEVRTPGGGGWGRWR